MNESFENKVNIPRPKIEAAEITNPTADQAGEYIMHRNTALDILNLAAESGVITSEQSEVMVHDLYEARNAKEMLDSQRPLTRRLYQEGIDYSDILFRHGAIDAENYRELKSNISRGKDFTVRDLENADRLDTIGAQAIAGMEDPGIAGEEILRGLNQMNLSKKIHPENGPTE